MTRSLPAKWLATQALPLRWIASRCAPVLSYHACYEVLPPNIAAVDNVTPAGLYDHLAALKQYYHFVCIDEFCAARSRQGLAAVTFDDGYKSVIENALPVCAALDIPLTLFVTTLGLEGKTFWRHKVVAIEQKGLIERCERTLTRTQKIAGASWHEYSKHPSNNSKVVEQELDFFLATERITLERSDYLLDSERQFIDHPLLWYGNHTHHHYVLSSLPRAEQYEEIERTDGILRSLGLSRISRVFSIPFGQKHHINADGLAVLRELGFQAALLNRGRVNGFTPATRNGLQIVERFTPDEASVAWPLRREFLRSAVRPGGLPMFQLAVNATSTQ